MDNNFLTSHLLISMPSLDDLNFSKTVTLICQHDENGAIGIIINRLTEHSLEEIFGQLNIPVQDLEYTCQPVYDGGPVHQQLGLVIHTSKEKYESSITIGGNLKLTSSADILNAMAQGSGPNEAIMSLGYAGWGPGQLEEEIKQNSWLTIPAENSIIFKTPIDMRWKNCLDVLGIDPIMLSNDAGHA